jgi:hypothetical protein
MKTATLLLVITLLSASLLGCNKPIREAAVPTPLPAPVAIADAAR